jgi:putative ABC transport system permease protein
VSWLTVQLHRLADARAATGGLIALALVTSFLFAAAPRVIDARADDAMHATINGATSDTRNLAVSQTGRISAGSTQAPLAVVSATGDKFDQEFPASVFALVRARYTTIDTARFKPLSLEGRTVRMRYLEGATEHIQLVSGRLPTGQTGALAVPPDTLLGGTNGLNRPTPPPDSLVTFEVALSTASALDLGVGVGDKLQLRTDETDKLAGYSVSYVAVEVVGTYDVPDGADDYWFGDTSLERPQVRSLSSLNQIDDITALVSADAYPTLLDATFDSQLPLRYTWRYQIEATRLRTDAIDTLLPDLRRMESVFLASGATTSPNRQPYGAAQLSPPTLQSGLLRLATSYAGGWRAVSQILSIAEVGGGAVALLALSLVCLLAGRRRSRSLALWQSRGASRSHATAGTIVEVVLELALPVAVGAALAILVIPSRPLVPTLEGAGAVLVFAAALILANTWSASRDPAEAQGGGAAGGAARGSGRDPGTGRGLAAITRGAGPRRLALEALVVAGAILGAFILRQRGVSGAGTDVVLTSPDPLVAAVPALIGGAAALVVARLLPVPLELLARFAERRRGLVALLALRRATRRTNDRLLLTALLTMAAVWSFAAVSLAYLDRSSDVAGWQSVGSPYRITLDTGSLPGDFHLAALPGVQAVSGAAVLSAHVPEKNALLSVLALDVAAYSDVVKGGALDGSVPASLIAAEAAAPAAPSPGVTPDAAAPIPALVSPAFASLNGLHVGDPFELVVSGARPSFTVTDIRATFPTLAADTAWVVVPRAGLAAVVPGGEVLATEAFIKAGPEAGPAIAKALQDRLPAQGRLTSRYEATADLRNAPDYVAVVFGLAAASFVAAAYGALAIFVALLLAGTEQSRESAHLRVLGLSRGQNLGLSAMEHGPASLLVIVAGVCLGAGLFAFLQSGLGLGQLVGGDIDVGLPIEALGVAAIFGAIGAIVALAVGLETVAESIINPTAALRRGMD